MALSKDTDISLAIGILAGGRSTRMGQNKALMRLDNERIIDILSGEFADYDEVMISSGEKGIYEDTGLKVVYDEIRDIGPMEGIRRLLISSGCEYVFVCAADMPFMTKDVAEYLKGYISSDHDCYVVATDDHIEPLCAIYSKALIPVIESLISKGRYRLSEIFKRARVKYISLKYTCISEKCLKNINTKDEYIRLSFPAVFAVSGESGSGKTWLISKLINEFISDGFTVGVLKHDGCDVFCDVPGSDTDIYSAAGAVCSAIFSDTRYAMHVKRSRSAEEMTDLIKGLDPPPDIVIIEGLKDSSLPKIAVYGNYEKSCKDKKPCPVRYENVICTVTDEVSPEDKNVPVFGHEDVKGIYLCLKGFLFDHTKD